MKKALRAGAFVLSTVGLLSGISGSCANERATAGLEQPDTAAAINIGRIKSALRLTPEQERLWSPVEAALRELARQQEHAEPAGLVRRISRRVVSIVLNSAAVERLAVAARPLVAMLNVEQMQTARGLAQEMGLGAVVMAALR